jgi:Tfp pilus assembly protein PilO
MITKKTVRLMGISSIVILTTLGAVTVVQPLITNIQTQKEAVTTAEDEIKAIQTSRDSLAGGKDNYEEIAAINAQLITQFPELAEVPQLLDTITQGAVQSGINPADISSLTFAPPAVVAPVVAAETAKVAGDDIEAEALAGGGEAAPAAGAAPAADAPAAAPAAGAADVTVSTGEFAEMEIGINAEGSAESVQRFLSYLNTMDRVMLINGFSVDGGAPNDAGGASPTTLSLTGRVFVYKNIPTPDEIMAQSEEEAAIEDAGAATVDPDGAAPATDQ